MDFKLENQDAHSNGQSTYIKACNAPKQYGNMRVLYFILYTGYYCWNGVRKLISKKSYTPEDLERVREESVTYVQMLIECDG